MQEKLLFFFINKGKISKDDLDVYEYCFEMLFSTLFNTCLLIIGSLVTKRYYETIIFSIAFIIIRRCIGGYHAKTHIGCISILTTMFVTMVLLLNINYKILNYISICLAPICLIMISIFAPVGHPNNPLDDYKKEQMNAIAIFVSALYCLIIILSYFAFTKSNIAILITIPLVFSTISMVIGHYVYKNVIYV